MFDNQFETVPAIKRLNRALSMVDQVFQDLQSDIIQGRRKSGEQLPTEPSLAATFGVSRTVIREAVARLRNDGLLTARQGAGVFVSTVSLDRAFRMPLQSLESPEVLRELFEMRVAIESEAAALAATRRSDAELQTMRRLLGLMEKTRTSGDYGVAGDLGFHKAVATASGNAKIAGFQRYLLVFLQPAIAAQRAAGPSINQDTVAGDHAAIFAAIERADAPAARGAIMNHLQNAQTRLGLGRISP